MNTYYLLSGFNQKTKNEYLKKMTKNDVLIDETEYESRELFHRTISQIFDFHANTDKSLYVVGELTSIKQRAYIYKQIKRVDSDSIVHSVIQNDILYDLSNVSKEQYISYQPSMIRVDCDDIIRHRKKDVILSSDSSKERFLELIGYHQSNVDLSRVLSELYRNDYTKDVAVYELTMNITHHDNPYHKEQVDEHINYVIDYAFKIAAENKLSEQDKLTLVLAAIHHDLGKGIAKTFNDELNYSVYRGHETLSAKYADFILSSFDFDNDTIADVVTLVKNHMVLHDKNVDFDKFCKKHNINERLKRLLILLNEADISGTIK